MFFFPKHGSTIFLVAAILCGCDKNEATPSTETASHGIVEDFPTATILRGKERVGVDLSKYKGSYITDIVLYAEDKEKGYKIVWQAYREEGKNCTEKPLNIVWQGEEFSCLTTKTMNKVDPMKINGGEVGLMTPEGNLSIREFEYRDIK